MKKSINTNNKKATRSSSTSNNKKSEKSFNYRPIKIGAIKFSSSSKAAVHLLKHTKLNQSEIARRCGVSQPCVCQLAATVTRK
jgi:DNA-directed RNA polymerase specialized sigma subunit